MVPAEAEAALKQHVQQALETSSLSIDCLKHLQIMVFNMALDKQRHRNKIKCRLEEASLNIVFEQGP